MATELKMKRSSVASKIPTTSQLELGEIAINTYDGKMYIKKDDGTASVVEVGASNAGAVFNRDSFVATSGQTNFVCTSALSNAYVYLNGLLLNETTDYTISGSTVVLTTAATLNDEIEIFSFGAVVLDDITATYTKSNYTATANQSSLTVNYNVGLIDIYLNGVKLVDGSDYTATNGTSVTFTSNLSAGDAIEVISWNATNIANRFDSFTYYGKAAEAISTGDLVMFGGAQGDHLLFKKADSSATGFIPQWVIGVAATDLPLNAFGNVTSMGIIYGVNTSSYSVGDLLYMDHNTAGALTTTAPTAPDHNILVAAVTRVNASTGQIVVRVTHQPDTDEVAEGSTNLYYTDARVDTYANSGSLSGLSVGGNIAVTGTVDGRDVATDGTKLDGIEANADVTDSTNVDAAGAVMNSDTSVAAMSFVIDEDTMASNLATKVPTQQSVKAYVDAEVAGLVDSAPGTLDTLNELAAALGDDPNFATTVSNNISTKVSKSGDTMTGNLSFGDNDKAIFGAGSDLQIYHDGTRSYIEEGGLGGLWISTNGTEIKLKQSGGADEEMLVATPNGSVDLYYNNNLKLATTSTGVDITGTASVDNLLVDNAGKIYSLGQIELQVDADNNQTGTYIGFSRNNTTSERLALFQENGDISFYEDTGTTAKFFWDASAESLGIGTSSPSGKLQAYISANRFQSLTGAAADLEIVSDNNTNPVALIKGTGTADLLNVFDNTAEVFTILDGGNVGIGTSSPSERLHVSTPSSSGTEVAARFSSSTDASGCKIERSGSAWRLASQGALHLGADYDANGTSPSSTIIFEIDAAEKMHIDSSGLLKIGTSGTVTPYSLSRFAIDTGTYAFMDLLSTGSSGINFGDAGGAQRGTIEYNHGSDYLRFGSAGAERMRIDSNGNLFVGKSGFGNNTAGHQIEASGLLRSVRANSEAALFNRTSSDGDIVTIKKDDSLVGSIGSASGQLEVKSNGNNLNVFIQGSRTVRFDSYRFYPETTNAYDIGYSTQRFKDGLFTGTIYAANFDSTSDATLKTNVETIPDALDKVQQLRGVSFDWIENGKSEVGVIAQEVEAVIPELVSTDDQGIKSVKYGNIVSVLIEAIKEQQEQIDELKAQLNS